MKINPPFQSDAALPSHLDSSRHSFQHSLPILSQFRQAFSHWFTTLTQAPEPRVTLKRLRSGEHYWEIYDPTIDRSITFFTAKEVRTWLEQRYYQ